MGDVPTVIPSFTEEQWTEALLADFPIPWSGAAARLPGGKVYAMFGSCAANLKIINDFLVYGFDASRIATATNGELELVADDFYGPGGLPRKTGESDDSYRARIQAGLFIPYTTREAFVQALTALTGVAPRLISPWIAGQTSAYDWLSFYDFDNPQAPGLYGDSSLAYQAFVEVDLPPATGTPQATAIWGYDAGAAYDIYTGVYWNLQAANFVTTEDIDALILRIKAFGITIWRKYLNANALPFPIPQSFHVASNQITFPITITPFNGPYIVIASCNWNADLYVTNLLPGGFVINANSPSPSGAILNYVIIPITLPGAGFVPLVSGQTTVTLPAPVAPAISSNRPAVTPSFNTTYWITNITLTTVTVELSNPASDGDVLYFYFFPPSQSFVDFPAGSGLNSELVTIPGLPASCPFATPSWNSISAPQVVPTGILSNFSNPSPSGAFLTVGFFPLD